MWPRLVLNSSSSCGDAGTAGPDHHVQLFCFGNTGSPSYAHLLGSGTGAVIFHAASDLVTEAHVLGS